MHIFQVIAKEANLREIKESRGMKSRQELRMEP